MTQASRPVQDRYDAQAVEAKWRAEWEMRGTNAVSAEALRTAKDPYYNLMMFPYPSAEGLHVGNIFAFTGADVHGRYWRLRGKTVFEPIGFDAFGIHSENYALKVQTTPEDLIPRNIANFTRQLKRMGGMFDWSHTVDTTQPGYYKWTQWIFLKLYEARARRAAGCAGQLVSVVQDRARERAGDRRLVRALRHAGRAAAFRCSGSSRSAVYAERLLDNLAGLDWSDVTRKAQANWIGRSEGRRDRLRRSMGGNGAVRVVHDASGHGVRRDLHGARARASAGRSAHVGATARSRDALSQMASRSAT